MVQKKTRIFHENASLVLLERLKAPDCARTCWRRTRCPPSSSGSPGSHEDCSRTCDKAEMNTATCVFCIGHFTLYIGHFTLYIRHCTLYVEYCTLYSAYCTLYIIRYTLNTAHYRLKSMLAASVPTCEFRPHSRRQAGGLQLYSCHCGEPLGRG